MDDKDARILQLEGELKVERKAKEFYRDELDRTHGLLLDNARPSHPFWEDPFFWVAFFAATLIMSFF